MNKHTRKQVRKEYEMAYRAFRKWWKLVDDVPCNGSMMGANAYYDNVRRSYDFGIGMAALMSTQLKRKFDYDTANPLWCGKWTFPMKKAAQS